MASVTNLLQDINTGEVSLDIKEEDIETCISQLENIDNSSNEFDCTPVSAEQDSEDCGKIKLEEGKEFHLFLSHCSKDEPEVIALLDILESEPYNLKCYIDRRDFTAGETTVANMHNAFSSSMGTVFFLSPNFITSMYCTYEIQTAVSMYLEGEIQVIPVILTPCDVPDEFRNIHHISDAIPEIVAQKIYKSLSTDKTKFKKLLPLLPMQAGQDRMNGNVISWNLSFSQKVIQTFKEIGIKTSERQFKPILRMAKSLTQTDMAFDRKTCHHLPSFLWSVIIVMTLCLVFHSICIFILPYQFGKVGKIYDNPSHIFSNRAYDGILYTVIMVIAVMLCWKVCFFILKVHRNREFTKTVLKVNKINRLSAMDVDCVFYPIPKAKNEQCKYVVMKYDFSECKGHLETRWNEKYIDYVTEIGFEEIWHHIINSETDYISKYLVDLFNFSKKGRYHNVIGHNVCFCEFLCFYKFYCEARLFETIVKEIGLQTPQNVCTEEQNNLIV